MHQPVKRHQHPLDVTGAPQIGELAKLSRPKHERANFGEVFFQLVLAVRLRCPSPAALRSRFAARRAEQGRVVVQLEAESGDVGFEDRF